MAQLNGKHSYAQLVPPLPLAEEPEPGWFDATLSVWKAALARTHTHGDSIFAARLFHAALQFCLLDHGVNHYPAATAAELTALAEATEAIERAAGIGPDNQGDLPAVVSEQIRVTLVVAHARRGFTPPEPAE